MEKINAEFSKHSPCNLTEALDQIGDLTHVVSQLVEGHNESVEREENNED